MAGAARRRLSLSLAIAVSAGPHAEIDGGCLPLPESEVYRSDVRCGSTATSGRLQERDGEQQPDRDRRDEQHRQRDPEPEDHPSPLGRKGPTVKQQMPMIEYERAATPPRIATGPPLNVV